MPFYSNDGDLVRFYAEPHKNIVPLEDLTARTARGGVGFHCFMTKLVLSESDEMAELGRLSGGYCIGVRTNGSSPEALHDIMSQAAHSFKAHNVRILKDVASNFYFIAGNLAGLAKAAGDGTAVHSLAHRLNGPEINIFADIEKKLQNGNSSPSRTL